MCIYCGTTKHRKIYENHFGAIPKDEDGRTYEVHHVDGNHSNNELDNLKIVSIKEHYDIHYAQEDYNACLKMGYRMKLSPEEKSRLASLENLRRVENGTHPFLNKEKGRIENLRRVENGTHHFLSSEISKRNNQQRVENGTHNLLNNSYAKERLKNGTHNFQRPDAPSQFKWKCEHCNKEGKSKGLFTRWHGNNCKKNTVSGSVFNV
jgi:hypothetical protein